MTCIIFSTPQEAGPFLKQYQRGRFDDLAESESFHDDNLLVTITGTGKIKATLRTQQLLQREKPDQIIHIGTCSALKPGHINGSAIGIHQVFEGDRIELSAPTYPRMPLSTPFPGLQKGVLVTQDHQVQAQEELSYWQRIADVSDMEGYAIAFVSAMHGVPCNLVKVISGTMLADDPDFQRTLANAHESIARFLLDHVVKK